jgi:ribosomal protein L33
MLLLVLGVWANLIEDRNANASERLMWKKYCDFLDKLNKFDEE